MSFFQDLLLSLGNISIDQRKKKLKEELYNRSRESFMSGMNTASNAVDYASDILSGRMPITDELERGELLKTDVIGQTPFTNKSLEILKNTPVSKKPYDPWGTYGSYSHDKRDIEVYGAPFPADTASHEFVHATDPYTIPSAQGPVNQSLGGSQGFYDLLYSYKGTDPVIDEAIKTVQRRGRGISNEYDMVRFFDVESFAELAEILKEKTLLLPEPIASRYRNIYNPQSKIPIDNPRYKIGEEERGLKIKEMVGDVLGKNLRKKTELIDRLNLDEGDKKPSFLSSLLNTLKGEENPDSYVDDWSRLFQGRGDLMQDKNSIINKYLSEVGELKQDTPFFNEDNTVPKWLNRVVEDIKNRGIYEGIHDISYPITTNPYVQPILEPIVSKARYSNYKGGMKNELINNLLGQKDLKTEESTYNDTNEVLPAQNQSQDTSQDIPTMMRNIFGDRAADWVRVLEGENSAVDPMAENRDNVDGTIDRGLFQINSNTFADMMRRKGDILRQNGITSYDDMFDPEKNMIMAKIIWDDRRSWGTSNGWDGWAGAPTDLKNERL